MLIDLAKDEPAAKTLDTTHLDDSTLYFLSTKEITITIQVAVKFAKKRYKSGAFHANALYQHARAPLDELHACRSENPEEIFSMFEMFVESMIQQMKLISLWFIVIY